MNLDKLKSLQSTVCAVTAMLLLAATFIHFPYGYYTLLRIFVFSSSAYMAFCSINLIKHIWAVLFIVTAILFNPLIPILLTKAEWAPIDFIVSGIFCAWIFL